MADNDGSGCVRFGELKRTFKDYRMRLSDEDCEKLFNMFEAKDGKTANYEELLSVLIVFLL